MNQFYAQSSFPINNSWALVGFVILGIWTLFWKGCSLWISSKNDSKRWFIALLIFNTVGILDIFFIFYIAKKRWSEIKDLLHTKI